MAITVNLRYTGKDGSAKKFAEEIECYLSDDVGMPAEDRKFIRE